MPLRILTVTGTRPSAASHGRARRSTANSRRLYGSAAPPPLRVTLGTGQPKFRSTWSARSSSTTIRTASRDDVAGRRRRAAASAASRPGAKAIIRIVSASRSTSAREVTISQTYSPAPYSRHSRRNATLVMPGHRREHDRRPHRPVAEAGVVTPHRPTAPPLPRATHCADHGPVRVPSDHPAAGAAAVRASRAPRRRGRPPPGSGSPVLPIAEDRWLRTVPSDRNSVPRCPRRCRRRAAATSTSRSRAVSGFSPAPASRRPAPGRPRAGRRCTRRIASASCVGRARP